MTDEERSALDIIYSLPSILKKLESKIDVIDNNVKILNNKLIKLSQEKEKRALEEPTLIQEEPLTKEEKAPIRPRAESPDSLPKVTNIRQEPQKKQESTKLVLGNKKVYGFIKTTSLKPVPGATVKIFEETNSLIREIISNKDGYWECRLPAGKFSAEVLIGGIKPINRSFDLTDDIKEFELK